MGCGGSKLVEAKQPKIDEVKEEVHVSNNFLFPVEDIQNKKPYKDWISIIPKPKEKGKPFKTEISTILKKAENYNLIKVVYYGFLEPSSNFQDCLITSNKELIAKLKFKISKTISETDDYGDLDFVPNRYDELFFKDKPVDFNYNRMIAIRGAYIEHVREENGIYTVLTSEDQEVEENEYCAAVIEIPIQDEDEQTKIQPLVRAVPNKWKFVFPPKRKITF